LKIAMISEHASPLAALGGVDAGGQNLHVAELSRAMVRTGHEVTVYTRREDPTQPARVRAPGGVEVVHVPAGPAEVVPKDELLPYMDDFAQALTADWLATPPDIAHAHFWMSGLAAVNAGHATGVPVVQTFHALGTVKRRHQGTADTSPTERVQIEQMVGRQVEQIAATCTDEVFELTRMGLSKSRISVIPCGVDIDQFQPGGERAARTRWPKRVLSIGRMVPRKGFDLLIEAVRGLPDTELLIAGGPRRSALAHDPEGARLLKLVKRYGLSERVRLLGQVPRDKVPALIRSADVVACTPWYEPFGIVPLEAMACGIPVVATAVGGMVDSVVDGLTGQHVPARNARALYFALQSLLADPVRRAAYGAAGRDRVISRYSWDRVCLETLRIYRSTLHGSLPHSGRVTSRTAGVPR
jgi:glycosyltransferase involved in cell wall biosynthesis